MDCPSFFEGPSAPVNRDVEGWQEMHRLASSFEAYDRIDQMIEDAERTTRNLPHFRNRDRRAHCKRANDNRNLVEYQPTTSNEF